MRSEEEIRERIKGVIISKTLSSQLMGKDELAEHYDGLIKQLLWVLGEYNDEEE